MVLLFFALHRLYRSCITEDVEHERNAESTLLYSLFYKV